MNIALERGAPITRRTFHLLRVLREDVTTRRDNRNRYYWCECECGRVVSVSRSNLLSNHTKSCGCIRRSYKVPADLQERTQDA